jgi:branched-chain amino acid transport system permease protein
MELGVFIQQIVNGLMLGSTYSLIAIGFTLVFGLLSLLNMAHGEVYMMGAFIGWFCVSTLNLPFFYAVGIAIICSGLLGVLIELLCFRFVNQKYQLASLLSTIGFGIILQNIAIKFSGGEMVRFPTIFQEIDFSIGPVILSGVQIIILITAVLLMISLTYLIMNTKIGKGMRAVAENWNTARLMGINVTFIIVFTFIISSALAGISGILTALAYHSISPYMGVQHGLKGLAVIVLGGLGSIRGAMVGGIIIGLAEVFAIAYMPPEYTGYKNAIAFAILIGILLIKPSGIFGEKTTEERV